MYAIPPVAIQYIVRSIIMIPMIRLYGWSRSCGKMVTGLLMVFTLHILTRDLQELILFRHLIMAFSIFTQIRLMPVVILYTGKTSVPPIRLYTTLRLHVTRFLLIP